MWDEEYALKHLGLKWKEQIMWHFSGSIRKFLYQKDYVVWHLNPQDFVMLFSVVNASKERGFGAPHIATAAGTTSEISLTLLKE